MNKIIYTIRWFMGTPIAVLGGAVMVLGILIGDGRDVASKVLDAIINVEKEINGKVKE